MQYNGVQQLDQSNISQFTKKIPFLGKGNLGPIWSKIMQPCLIIHSLRIFLKICGMMRHQTKVALVTFSKNFLFGQYRPIWLKITQPTALEIFRNILARCGVIVKHQSYFSIFQKDSLFGLEAIRAKIMKLFTYDLLCDKYFDMAQHDEIKQLDQSNVGQLFQKILIWRSNFHPVWAKIMQPSVLLFAL